jgi:hypothetical protein
MKVQYANADPTILQFVSSHESALASRSSDRPHPVDQPSLELATEGVQRYVWQSAFGPMLIEVRDDAAFVNGKRVLTIAELYDAGPLA